MTGTLHYVRFFTAIAFTRSKACHKVVWLAEGRYSVIETQENVTRFAARRPLTCDPHRPQPLGEVPAHRRLRSSSGTYGECTHPTSAIAFVLRRPGTLESVLTSVLSLLPVTSTSSNGPGYILRVVVPHLHLSLAFDLGALCLRTPAPATWVVVIPMLISYLRTSRLA